MDERLRFVARLLEGEKMAPLCAELGISRKTGYKIFERYKDCGLGAFTDRSRRPFRQPNRPPAPLEATIVRLKREYPGWGAPQIREKLRRQVLDVQLPAISTVHAVLDRHGLVRRRRRRRPAASSTAHDPGCPDQLGGEALVRLRDIARARAVTQGGQWQRTGASSAPVVDPASPPLEIGAARSHRSRRAIH
jgi:hypothetical protein